MCDGVMTICTICDQAHIPEESISFDGLVSALKEGLVSQTLPNFQPGTKKVSRKISQTVSIVCHNLTIESQHI